MTRIDTPTGLEDGSLDLWTIEERARDARAQRCAELMRAAFHGLSARFHRLATFIHLPGHHGGPTAHA